MAKHESKAQDDGQGVYDPTKTKPVEEAGGGKHGTDNQGRK